MIVTIWWEDSLQRQKKDYGPDLLLAACVADDLGRTIRGTVGLFHGQPKNGAGSLLKCLKEDAPEFHLGPLCAVFDRDRILDLWKANERPAPCKSGICSSIRRDAPGDYGLVLLFNNMESLVEAACKELGKPIPEKSPAKRDDVLGSLAHHHDPSLRQRVREAVDGFDRLVQWTTRAVRDLI